MINFGQNCLFFLCFLFSWEIYWYFKGKEKYNVSPLIPRPQIVVPVFSGRTVLELPELFEKKRLRIVTRFITYGGDLLIRLYQQGTHAIDPVFVEIGNKGLPHDPAKEP